MPRRVVKVQFNSDQGTNYLTDAGLELNVKSRFVLPPDIPETEITTILTLIGATPPSAMDDGAIPCPDIQGGSLRKLQFIRANGGSMSVPVSSRVDLLSAATVIRGILNSNGSEVACIKLIGEQFPDLADELGLNYSGNFAQSHVPIGGEKQFVYAGNIEYETDATTGVLGSSTVFQPVKSFTNIQNAPATSLGAAWGNCVGAFSDNLACRGKGRRNPRKHRRYILTLAVKRDIADATENAATEVKELPVTNAEATEILNCGQDAASLAGVYCIGYQGESYSRFHKLLA